MCREKKGKESGSRTEAGQDTVQDRGREKRDNAEEFSLKEEKMETRGKL
jgi:hypothetical protein